LIIKLQQTRIVVVAISLVAATTVIKMVTIHIVVLITTEIVTEKNLFCYGFVMKRFLEGQSHFIRVSGAIRGT